MEESTENCDHVTGACTCLEGWTGDTCDKTCSAGYYGYKCKKECECRMPNMAKECDHRNGECHCEPGFTSQYCNQTCPASSYGFNCENKCLCENNSTCNNTFGYCHCLTGFQGKFCEEVVFTKSTVVPSPGNNSSNSGRSTGDGSASVVTPVMIAVAVAMVAIILIIVLVYFGRKRVFISRTGNGLSTKKLVRSPRCSKSVDRVDDEGNYTEDHVSLNPIYGHLSNPDSTPLDVVQSPGNRPTSMTIKSVNNPNYENTLTLRTDYDKRTSNPIYQTATELDNPLYNTDADINPLYEAGPSGSVSRGSGSLADMNPLYQSATSYRSQCDFNPLYESSSDVSPLYEAAVPAAEKKNSKARRRADSRTKKEDKVPIMDNAPSCWSTEDEDGLGVSNRGVDVTFNELYGSVEQTSSSPTENEPGATPLPPSTAC